MGGQWCAEYITHVVDPGTECEVENIKACLTITLYAPIPTTWNCTKATQSYLSQAQSIQATEGGWWT